MNMTNCYIKTTPEIEKLNDNILKSLAVQVYKEYIIEKRSYDESVFASHLFYNVRLRYLEIMKIEFTGKDTNILEWYLQCKLRSLQTPQLMLDQIQYAGPELTKLIEYIENR